MTRENKLALIVSFALILVVGVLISDHLSKANQTELGQTIAERPIVRPPANILDPVEEAIVAAQDRSRQTGTASPAPGTILPQYAQGTGQAVVIDERRDPAEQPLLVPEMTAADRALAAAARKQGIGVEWIKQGAPAALLNRTTVPGSTTPRPAPQPQTIEYVVEEGDSLYRIAERLLGAGDRWPEIQMMNKSVVGANGSVREGARLRIPVGPDAAPSRAARTTTRSGQPRTYVVRSDDTLGEIAQRELGSAKRMQEILDLNKDHLANENLIYAGMKLRLPPR